MKSDTNPSIIFGCYAKPQKYKELLQKIEKRDLAVREIRFIDVEMPLDDRYDENINWFKSFIQSWYWKNRNPLLKDNFMMNQLIKQIEKSQYKPIRFDPDSWEPDKKHSLIWALPVPLFVQDQTKNCTTDEERAKMKKLLKFESTGYLNDTEKQLKDWDKDIIQNFEETTDFEDHNKKVKEELKNNG